MGRTISKKKGDSSVSESLSDTVAASDISSPMSVQSEREAPKKTHKEKKSRFSAGLNLVGSATKKFEEGNKQASKGKYLRAKTCYLQALTKKPDDEMLFQIYVAIGNVALKQSEEESTSKGEKGKFSEETVDYYKKALELYEDDNEKREVINVKAKLGNVFYSTGDIEAALLQYAEIMEHKMVIDKYVVAQMIYNSAMIKYREEKYDEAQSLLQEIISKKSNISKSEISYHLGKSSFHAQDYESAIKAFSIFLKDSKDGQKFDKGEVHLMLVGIYEKEGKTENLELALEHHKKYLHVKHPKILVRLQSNTYVGGIANSSMVDVYAKIHQLSYKAENYFFAGNCLREAYFATRSFQDELTLFPLMDKAYICYKKAKNSENRILMLQELTTLLEETQDSNSPLSISVDQRANYYEALGNLLKKTNDHNAAFESFLKCLDVRIRHLGPNDFKVGKLQCKISSNLYNEGKYEKALDFCQSAAYCSNDIVTSRKALCIVGKIRAKQLDKEGCTAAFTEALELARLTGEDSLDLAATYELFGQANFHLEMFEESIECFLESYNIKTMNEETTAPECIALIQSMVGVYKMMNKFKLALVATSKILMIQQEHYPPTSLEVASSMESMADFHSILGGSNDYINAIELYRISSDIVRDNKGSSAHHLLQIYVKMAIILGFKHHEYEKALKLFKIVNDYFEKGGESTKPFFALRALEGEGDVHSKLNDHKAAIRRYRTVLEDIGKLESCEIPQFETSIFSTKVNLFYKAGKIFEANEEYDEALNYLDQGLKMKVKQNISPEKNENVQTSQFLYEIGVVLRQSDEREKAIEKFHEASEILKLILELDTKGKMLSDHIEKQLRLCKKKGCFCF